MRIVEVLGTIWPVVGGQRTFHRGWAGRTEDEIVHRRSMRVRYLGCCADIPTCVSRLLARLFTKMQTAPRSRVKVVFSEDKRSSVGR